MHSSTPLPLVRTYLSIARRKSRFIAVNSLNGISLILAVMIWRTWPFSSVWAIGTLVGISMLFTGFSRLMLILSARRVLHA